jgi:dipeptidyl aminopeptidase/acylaminoacyl peptidase
MALWMAGRHLLPQSHFPNDVQKIPLERVVSLAGVVDLLSMWQSEHGRDPVEQFLGGPPMTCPNRYRETSPINLLPTDTFTVLVHGTEDSRVPLTQSQDYWLKARTLNSPVILKTLPGMDHFQLIDPHSSAWPTVVAAVREPYPLYDS